MDGVTWATILQLATAGLAVLGAVWTVRRDGEAREARIIGRIDVLADRVGTMEADIRSASAELRATLTGIAGRVDAHDREHERHRSGLQSQGQRVGAVETTLAVHADRIGRA
jgi:hypothetical protein